MAGQLPDTGVRFNLDPSEAAQYSPDLSENAVEPPTKIIGTDHPYALIITTLDELDEYMQKGKAGMGINGAVLVSLTDDARQEARARNDTRIANEIRRRGLPETTTLEQFNKIIEAEHAEMAARDTEHLKGLLAKYALEANQAK